jgi:hypothetical protein
MAPERTVPSRRVVVGGGVGTGLLAAFGTKRSPAKGENQPMKSLQNPVTEYPRPPFQKQQQEWPGLASKMSPRADHGETTYKGSGRLAAARRSSPAAIQVWAALRLSHSPLKERM